MNVQDFDYVLPESLIAIEPASPRDACRLMVVSRKDETLENCRFFELVDLLREGDVLVFNNSKVLPARLLLEHNGREVEIFLTKRLNETDWLTLVRPGKLLVPGVSVRVGKDLELKIVKVEEDGQRLVRFSDGGSIQNQVLQEVGHTPLPPYIKNSRAHFDDYQTVYAEDEGSVAAPTAGLHFTENLLQKLEEKGVQLEFVRLDVGIGTFRPIKTDKVEEHFMHSERYILREDVASRLNTAKKEGRRIIAVGTTSVRVLEDSFDKGEGFLAGERETNIFIYPGYEWQCVDGLITNFHLPKSSLLLLVSAFAGKDFILKAYEKAIQENYRFYSFGDAMFIE
ncbi:MAG TPA: tRNA preQ1(34) S-adenosylmethionine ribosyltransferase-isomerase QueA [Candidatus Gracilibacteria bacterium]|nr:tRNA preQ1(34) S-adenosylmethionine ribosyltransferase-isomerase QueA [Candidatus Gracilibacteria bacterium]